MTSALRLAAILDGPKSGHYYYPGKVKNICWECNNESWVVRPIVSQCTVYFGRLRKYEVFLTLPYVEHTRMRSNYGDLKKMFPNLLLLADHFS